MLSRLFILFWLVLCGNAYAGGFDYSEFGHIPVQHEGRVKPLSTFALIYLEHFYGKSQFGDMSATEWLAESMFDPARAMERPIFLIKDTDAQSMLGLPDKEDHLYTYIEITHAVNANQKLIGSLAQTPSQSLSSSQRTVIDLYESTSAFTQILLSDTLYLHLTIALSSDDLHRFGIDSGASTFADYYKSMPAMQQAVKDLIKRKGTNPDKYTPPEEALAQLMNTLSVSMNSTGANTLLRIIPPQWNSSDEWLSPWAIFHSGQGSPESAELMRNWREIVASYQSGDADAWQKSVHAFAAKTASNVSVRPTALSLEILYYKWQPLAKSMLLYVLALVMILLCWSGLPNLRQPLRLTAITATAVGTFMHAASILIRVYILERPPVGTLYESLLFVSLIAVLMGLFIERRLHNYLGLLVATVAGSGLLIASQSFSGEDTMGMLIAVLNTNFWLATHVLCVTTGYGFGLVTGLIAHAYLIIRIIKPESEKTREILRAAYGAALIALLFTSLGTILGGIWADQSWGRFWGWDPKENGALVICLWLIWLLHSSISGHVHERGFSVGLALLNVVIALSWLGVNLLATGLHSYGFTDKAAYAFIAFCSIECVFAGLCYYILWQRDHAEIL